MLSVILPVGIYGDRSTQAALRCFRRNAVGRPLIFRAAHISCFAPESLRLARALILRCRSPTRLVVGIISNTTYSGHSGDCVIHVFALQWNLRTRDTLGAMLMSLVERSSLSRRFIFFPLLTGFIQLFHDHTHFFTHSNVTKDVYGVK